MVVTCAIVIQGLVTPIHTALAAATTVKMAVNGQTEFCGYQWSKSTGKDCPSSARDKGRGCGQRTKCNFAVVIGQIEKFGRSRI